MFNVAWNQWRSQEFVLANIVVQELKKQGAKDAEIERPKASRGRGIGMGVTGCVD